MIDLQGWQAALLGLVLLVAAILLAVWWRQHTYRWALVVALAVLAAPLLSLWSTQAFEVPDYRAGCDGICPGYRGAPIPSYSSDGSAYVFSPVGFGLNSLAYVVIILGWGAVVRAVVETIGRRGDHATVGQTALGLLLFVAPIALSPWLLPAPEAHVRGDPFRVAINANREVFMYDQQASMPVLRVALNDVRPRPDGEAGMRVCLRTYTFFYLPTGYLYLDMTPEGVHSNHGGFLPLAQTCWP